MNYNPHDSLNRATDFRASESRPRGFTLIELLVVISVVALLLSLLLPALSAAKETANTAMCSSGLKQTLTAAIAYSIDYRDYPDMTEASQINLTPHGNHPQFLSGVINRTGASGAGNGLVYTVNNVPNRPKWYSELAAHQGTQSVAAYSCTASRGNWSRKNTWVSPYYGFGFGIQGNSYLYYGPGMHSDDVNPQGVITSTSPGLMWVSNALRDPSTTYPANWDLHAKNSDPGVLFCCPSPAYDGSNWGGPAVGNFGYYTYNTDIVWIRPHGPQKNLRNYAFTDGHTLSTEQKSVEVYPTVRFGSSWSPSPNGYF